MSGINQDLRKRIAWMTWHSREGHIPSGFSIIDILDILYGEFLEVSPTSVGDPGRDFFILSKGHGSPALWAVLEKYGFISAEDINNKNGFDGILATHPDRNKVPAVEASTGSLGNGIGMALGIALGLKSDGLPNKVYTLVGDAECNEGTVWETFLLAGVLGTGNMCVVVDYNHSADPTVPMGDLVSKVTSFGWDVVEIDGHSPAEIRAAFQSFLGKESSDRPFCVIANTVKGKGSTSMEQNFGHWHSKVPSDQELGEIYEEIDAN